MLSTWDGHYDVNIRRLDQRTLTELERVIACTKSNQVSIKEKLYNPDVTRTSQTAIHSPSYLTFCE